jgi:putative FmdB family regulatory protein
MPIYEYRCENCGKISEFLIIKTDEKVAPHCKRCSSKKMSRVLSRVRVVRSEESRMESLADPAKWGDLDEKDPKSVAKMMKRMGKEMGEDMDMNMDEMEQAIEEEMTSPKPEGGSEGEPGD